MVGITVAVVLVGAPAFAPTPRAAADPISATRSAISALQAQAATGATQIHALTLAYEQANVQAMALAQQVTQDQVDISQLQQNVDASRTALQKEAILSYTDGSTPGTTPSTSGASDPAVRAEYIQVAAGDLTEAVDQYRTQQVQLATAESALKKQERASQEALAAMASARQQALAQAAAEQAQLDQLQGHLNQLVEAAAVAATASRPAPPTQGTPVNNGIVRVVQTIVSQPAAAAPAPTPAPAPVAAPVSAAPVTSGGGAGGVWLQLRECESGDNYQENTGNGFYGAYQFSAQTWTNLGYPGRPDLEPPAMQDAAAMKLQAESGWGQWPACAAALGLT
jgi:Transglycosylase-like domain